MQLYPEPYSITVVFGVYLCLRCLLLRMELYTYHQSDNYYWIKYSDDTLATRILQQLYGHSWNNRRISKHSGDLAILRGAGPAIFRR